MTTIASADDIRLSLQGLVPLDIDWLTYLIDVYPRFNEIAMARLHLGWRPVGGEVEKFSRVLDRRRLHRFADYVFGGIGFEFENDFFGSRQGSAGEGRKLVRDFKLAAEARENVLHRAQHEAKVAASAFPDVAFQWGALTAEPANIGGVLENLRIDGFETRVSHQSLRVSWRAPRMVSWLGHAPTSILEIGGGHGKFVRDCGLLLPDTRLFLVDLPFNLIVQARYLREYFGDAVHLCLMDDQAVDPDTRINLVAPWRMNEIPGPVDVAANFLSFQHMDRTNLDWYGAALQALSVEYLYHQNRLTRRDPFDFGADDYPFRSQYQTAKRLETPSGRAVDTDGTVRKLMVATELLIRS